MRLCVRASGFSIQPALPKSTIIRSVPADTRDLLERIKTCPCPVAGAGTSTISDAEHRFAACNEQWEREEGGYNLIQETKPQTLAYGLNDSPAGLAAWIIEKWRSWGAMDGHIERSFTMDELLTNVTIYWVTQTANSSSRSYYERARDQRSFGLNPKITVPTGVALTMETVQRAPREWVERVYTDIRHWTEFDRGGHFLAIEDPALLAADIRTFFRQLR